MKAPQTFQVVEQAETRMRGACLINGCSCKDSRIVSHRRAAFFAALAARSGQTADRVVRVESTWRIPLPSHPDLEVPIPNAFASWEGN
jgi:hypothetical protein